MDMKELRQKSDAELKTELLELRQTQFKLMMQKATGQLSRPDLMKKTRRDIARVKTLLRERSQMGNQA